MKHLVTTCHAFNNATELLRAHGLRVTPQRLALAEIVFARSVHITARMAYDTLRETHPAISMNTIYLTLGQFESSGLLQHFEVNGNTVFDSNTAPHDHACCNRCGIIIDLSNQPAQPTQMPSQLDQWQIQGERRMWLGLCPICTAASV